MLARCAAEDAAEDARRAAQLARVDLTPITDPSGWSIETVWRPVREETDTWTSWSGERTRREATRTGLQFACCSGALRIRVFAPTGAVVESWDREGNFWLTHDEDQSASGMNAGATTS